MFIQIDSISLNFTHVYSFVHEMSLNFTQQIRFRVTTMNDQKLENAVNPLYVVYNANLA